jgi:hypothetical protein
MISTYPDGSKCVGEFRDGKPNGQRTQTWTDGGSYVGVWRDARALRPQARRTGAARAGSKRSRSSERCSTNPSARRGKASPAEAPVRLVNPNAATE